jgi:mRNA interferase RelE/StbE
VFRLEIDPGVLKELAAIQKGYPALYRRLVAAIDSLPEEPYQGKKLSGELADRYSLRVGPYRILYRIFKDRLVIFVIDVGHRREVYR